jgi:hypothetical protein
MLILGSTLLIESVRGYDGPITAERKDVGRVRGDVAHVDDRAASLVDTTYQWRSRRLIGRRSSRWVGPIPAHGDTC